ncbi:MAG: ATP-binding protein [Anaerolineae bacterium]|nr:ATP-binding protein [Anaerolineae bacterium]
MNRLWVRLTLALVAITLLSVSGVAMLAQLTAANQLNVFVERQRHITQQGIIDELAAFYAETGSWDGVGNEVIAQFLPSTPRRQPPPGQRPNGPPPNRTSYAIANANGKVVYDDTRARIGINLPSTELSRALPITVNQQTVGYLITILPEQSLQLDAQLYFVDQLQRNLVVAAAVVSLVAVALGALISRALAKPLAQLAQTARTFSSRNLSARAQPDGTVEIAEVAHAFNDMADSLQQAEINRRNLTADIAHELRTPLSVIQGNLRAMLDGIYPLEPAEIATIYDETRLLSRLVDDLRELALAEAGQLALRPQVVDIAALAHSAIDQFTAVAENRQITLSANLPNLPTVLCDTDRTAQVLRNLIGNALRHTPSTGHIALVGAVDGAMVRLSVRDTGEGIAPDDLPHVFERFYRGDKSRTRSSGGTGLGLAIVKSLVEAMGGRIGVTSTLGQGSSFWFTLPVATHPKA